MAQRLSINETEFLLKLITTMESAGDAVLNGGSFKEAGDELMKYFTIHRQRQVDTVNKIRIVKEKVESHITD